MHLNIFYHQYHWADGNMVKIPIKCSAPRYIDYLMTWIQDQVGTGPHIYIYLQYLHISTISM